MAIDRRTRRYVRIDDFREAARQRLPRILDLSRFCSGQVLMLGGPLCEGHG